MGANSTSTQTWEDDDYVAVPTYVYVPGPLPTVKIVFSFWLITATTVVSIFIWVYKRFEKHGKEMRDDKNRHAAVNFDRMYRKRTASFPPKPLPTNMAPSSGGFGVATSRSSVIVSHSPKCKLSLLDAQSTNRAARRKTDPRDKSCESKSQGQSTTKSDPSDKSVDRKSNSESREEEMATNLTTPFYK